MIKEVSIEAENYSNIFKIVFKFKNLPQKGVDF
ncbi:hypothetical protein EMA8858_03687 [Emticicia aquatica]|uniref:Uncharacterized protein n=1 Tax=Emticicia aquatica TaxID=1681835 RepID=A0ABM9AVG3_9BACT|nr:hypothetical protein EMA8858_03687 [Emticicia aquatica]